MRAIVMLLVVSVSALLLGQSVPATTTASAPALAADSLVAQAVSLGRLPSAVGRIGRMQTLLEYARFLQPDNPQANRELVELYQALRKVRSATAPARGYLAAQPKDYQFWLQYLSLEMAGRENAGSRIAFLKSVAGDAALLPEVRSACQFALAELLLRQGDDQAARQALASSLELDAHNSQALRLKLQLTSQPTTQQSFDAALAALQGEPRSLELLWDIAQRLQDAGLAAQALQLYDQVMNLWPANRPGLAMPLQLQIDYDNALLDAGQNKQAAEQIAKQSAQQPPNLALLSLLYESHQALGQKDEAAGDVAAMAKVYQAVTTRPTVGPADQAELAWFALRYKGDAKQAVLLAAQAYAKNKESVFITRVQGAAQLAGGDQQEGVTLLKSLAGSDAQAAAILARHYLDKGDIDAAKGIVQNCRPSIHSGPAWRELAALAAKAGVFPPPGTIGPDQKALAEQFDKAAPEILSMGSSPEKFLQVWVSAPKEVIVGRPVEINIELANISDKVVPLGRNGVLLPMFLANLSVDGPAKIDLQANATVMPAPKYLQPGQKVTQTLRLDVGQAQQLLMSEPLADLTLTVNLIADPAGTGAKAVSSLPKLKIEPVVIHRLALIPPGLDKAGAQKALAGVLRDLKEGDLPTQMRAAWQTAALLNYVRLSAGGKAPPIYPDVLTEGLLVALTGRFLQSDQPALRAEMLAALSFVPLDDQIIALLAPLTDDTSPLVRMQLIALLAGQATRGYEKLQAGYAKDPDRFVRDMAAAFGKPVAQ